MNSERKMCIRISIENSLKFLNSDAKKGYKSQALRDYSELVGILRYMSLVGDIDEITYQKVYKLANTIKRKYHIY